jgi:hypothetical protein
VPDRVKVGGSGPLRYRIGVTVVETVLVFVGIPAGITFVIFLAVFGKSLVRQPNRYRPGKAWTYPSSWYVPHPDAVVSARSGQRQIEAGASSTTAVGGASGEW